MYIHTHKIEVHKFFCGEKSGYFGEKIINIILAVFISREKKIVFSLQLPA